MAARIAILVCLENSFWHIQHGTNASVGFTTAWHNYHAIQHVVLNQKLNNYLRLKGSKDWFTGRKKNGISEEECMDYADIILSNLLRKLILIFLGQANLMPYIQPALRLVLQGSNNEKVKGRSS